MKLVNNYWIKNKYHYGIYLKLHNHFYVNSFFMHKNK